MQSVTAETLSDAVEFDSPFRVYEGGKIGDAEDIYAPELMDGELLGDGWAFISGYSGQDGYSGPIMHSSEYLGGKMAQDVLDEPGLYCMVPAYYTNDEDPADGPFIEGWTLVRFGGEWALARYDAKCPDGSLRPVVNCGVPGDLCSCGHDVNAPDCTVEHCEGHDKDCPA
jgi:hypothetical protein